MLKKPTIKLILMTDDGRPNLRPTCIPPHALLVLRGKAKHDYKPPKGFVSYANWPNIKGKGLHLSEHQPKGRLNLRLWQRRYFITASCHSLQGFLKMPAFVDGVIFSPLFATLSHPSQMGKGFFYMRRMQKIGKIYVMGGVAAKNLQRIHKSSLSGKLAGVAGVEIVAELQHKTVRLHRLTTK